MKLVKKTIMSKQLDLLNNHAMITACTNIHTNCMNKIEYDRQTQLTIKLGHLKTNTRSFSNEVKSQLFNGCK